MTMVRYLFRKFIPLFIGAVFFFSFAFVMVDLLMNLWNYINNDVPGKQILYLMVLYIPKTVWYATPIAILFAVSYTLSDLYAKNELVAIFASGISLLRFTMPLLVFSFILSFGLFFFENNLVVQTYAKKTELQTKLLNKEESKNKDNIVILGDMGNIVYKASFYDDAAQRLYSLYIVARNQDKSLQAVIKADSARWVEDEEHWRLSNAIQYKPEGDTLVITSVDDDVADRLNEPPETFRNNTVSVETVNTVEARAYIEHLKRTGLPYNKELSEYYKKYAFPFILFVVVFLSIGLSGKTRKNVMLISLASSISAAVLFYVTQMVTMLMANFGILTPFMGAWFPVFLFVIISIVLLKHART